MSLSLKKPRRRRLSRRHFVALSCVGTAGISGTSWLASSNTFAARFVRDRLAERKQLVAVPKFKPDPQKWDTQSVTAAWLGHSTVLLNIFGVTVLTDPVLFRRVGADVGIGTVGPKRLIAPALALEELPPIDLVLLSHAHFDHWDMPTLRHFGPETQAVVARATFDLLKGMKFGSARELAWGDKSVLRTRHGEVQIEAFEVRHWGARMRSDTYRGYNGYVISRGDRRIIFGGDTAITSAFADLKSRGPFDLACMPIGAYNPWAMSHCNPEEAVSMANEAGARYILPIHHQTFKLSREPALEPIERLQTALQKEPERLAWRNVGETFVLKT